jgi:Low affinity iron permease
MRAARSPDRAQTTADAFSHRRSDQLEINTTTTIITFLMVALLQNSQTRENQATQHKLNAIADGVADLMEHISERNDDSDLKLDVEELRCAVGLEARESTTRNTRAQSPLG